mgnify:CR=1 FL=1
MKLKNLDILTKTDEEIRIDDFDFIGLSSSFFGTTKVFDGNDKGGLVIECPRGRLEFKLEEIESLFFVIANEEKNSCIVVGSEKRQKWVEEEEDAKI